MATMKPSRRLEFFSSVRARRSAGFWGLVTITLAGANRLKSAFLRRDICGISQVLQLRQVQLNIAGSQQPQAFERTWLIWASITVDLYHVARCQLCEMLASGRTLHGSLLFGRQMCFFVHRSYTTSRFCGRFATFWGRFAPRGPVCGPKAKKSKKPTYLFNVDNCWCSADNDNLVSSLQSERRLSLQDPLQRTLKQEARGITSVNTWVSRFCAFWGCTPAAPMPRMVPNSCETLQKEPRTIGDQEQNTKEQLNKRARTKTATQTKAKVTHGDAGG